MTTTPRIAIIGGGPGGLMLARLLQLRGIGATVFERDSNANDRPQGGSLDLHADTGQHAFRIAGLEAAFLAEARFEDQGDRLYDHRGLLLFDRASRNTQGNSSTIELRHAHQKESGANPLEQGCF